ncbi:MAG: 4-hydroxythreonine-4-phosphate dehydrogenase PdxA [Desulfobacterales bacterium]|nr:4-hydroxythreonine-4-phosphate dehydrogenase PdxA [Desulfobacterales bacterium]
MNISKPIIGITMGDPVGIGPEIVLSGLNNKNIYELCNPVVFGDVKVLEYAQSIIKGNVNLNIIENVQKGVYQPGTIDIVNCSNINVNKDFWGKPNVQTSEAMMGYINLAIDMALKEEIAGVVTCPINKMAMKLSNSKYPGHTELFAERTNSSEYIMMMAGNILRVSLVTIHVALSKVPNLISTDKILKTIEITAKALYEKFGFENPIIAVAGLNPHSGEDGLFGQEESQIITPAINLAKDKGINALGPFPPDTVFYNASQGKYHAVICMYHDQGLIPFKMIHFKDGVNTTLGISIIRTSVDHGTAYDIAGTGQSDPSSLIAAIKMAAEHASCLSKRKYLAL